MRRQTFLFKPGQPVKHWHVVDADGVPLGRLAAQVGQILMGKHRPEYTPHVDCGDGVIIINATRVELTGNKAEQRLKMRYSEYPGGLKTETYGQVRERQPERLIADAVRRMLPKNRLARVMLKGLRVYPGKDHQEANLNPTPLTIA
jgi:large subunit ribosomal protein L13